jgi:thiol-disulfide isomerase/thioredoxin
MKRIILYHANWCGYCKRFIPEWDKLKEIIEAEKLDIKLDKYEEQEIEKNPKLLGDNKIQGWPTIVIEVDNKSSYYDGQRTAEALLDFMKSIESVDCNKPTKEHVEHNEQTGGDPYHRKYLKYKAKYLALKKLRKL